jgi:hypothetical protein
LSNEINLSFIFLAGQCDNSCTISRNPPILHSDLLHQLHSSSLQNSNTPMSTIWSVTYLLIPLLHLFNPVNNAIQQQKAFKRNFLNSFR